MPVLLIILASICVIAPLVVARRYGMLPWVSPLYFVAAFAFFGVFLKSIAYLITPEMAFFQDYVRNANAVGWGYFYVTLFVLAICAGYRFGVRRRLNPRAFYLFRASVRAVTRPKLLFVISATAFSIVSLEYLRQRGFSGLSDAFSFSTVHTLNSSKIERIEGVEEFGNSYAALKSFFVVPTLAFVIFFALQSMRSNLKNAIFTIVTLGICLLATILAGKRLELVFLLIYAICVKVMLGTKINGALVLRGVLGFFGVVAVFVFMTTLRTMKGDGQTAEMLYSLALFQVLNSTYFLDVNMAIIVTELSDPAGVFFGESYFWWLFGWIPRDFWPDKPAITLGAYVKHEVLGLSGIGGVNPTGPGEAFLNFGWFGVLMGVLLGFLYRRIEEFLLRPWMIDRGGSLWLYPILFFSFIATSLQSSFSGVIVSSAAEFVIIWLVLRLVTVRRADRDVGRSYGP